MPGVPLSDQEWQEFLFFNCAVMPSPSVAETDALAEMIPGQVPRSREDILIIDPVILNLAVALGIGLLIGAERERRKGEGPSRSPAGIRTFTVASLAGATSFIVGGEVLLAVATAGVIILTAVAYWRAHEDDPGLTTEIALILSVYSVGFRCNSPRWQPASRLPLLFCSPPDLGSTASSVRCSQRTNSKTP